MERPDTRKLRNANAAAWTEPARAGYDVYRQEAVTRGGGTRWNG